MHASLFHLGPWRVSEDGSQFENGNPSTGMVTLRFDEVVRLLITNESALKAFLIELATASSKKNRDPEFLINRLIDSTHAVRVRAVTASAEPVDQIRPPQPFDKDDGY